MKPSVILFFLAIPLITFAQSKQELEFGVAYELFEDEKYRESSEAFAAFMQKFPNHKLKPRAHFNFAYCQYRLGDTTQAIATFLNILEQKYNERDANNLMEPYTLYKHHASRHLAEIAIAQKRFDEAEFYIRLFHKKYPYQHFCGNEWAAYRIYKAVMDARLLEGKKQPELAIKVLAPHLFYNGLASNEEALEMISKLLERNYKPEAIKKIFNEALQSLHFINTRGETKATIFFYGVIVHIEDYSFTDQDRSLDDYRKLLRAHELFLKFL